MNPATDFAAALTEPLFTQEMVAMAPPDRTFCQLDVPTTRQAADTTNPPEADMHRGGGARPDSPGIGDLGTTDPQLDLAMAPGLHGEMVVTADGEIDLCTGPAFLSYLHRAMRHPSCRTLIADLRQVQFMGVHGITVLLTITLGARGRDVRLTLVADHCAVLRPLQITGVAAQFTLVPRSTRPVPLSLDPPSILGRADS